MLLVPLFAMSALGWLALICLPVILVLIIYLLDP